MVFAGRCSFSLGELKYEYPQEIVPAGETPASWLRKLTYEGVPKRFPGRAAASVPAADRERARGHRRARVRGLLPHRRRHRRLGARAEHPVPGPRQRRQLARLLLPLRHRGRSAPRDAAVRPLHQRRAQRAARHRHRLRAPAPRGGDPVHLRQVRPAPRGAHRRRHQLPAALGAARRRPGARHRPAADRDGLEEPALVRRPRHRPGAPARERLRSRSAGGAALDGAHRAADLAFRATSRSTPAASSSPRAAWPSWCRSRTRAMPDRSVIQWDKDDLDALGLLKVDILAIGMLSAIRRSLEYDRRQARPHAVRDAGHPRRRRADLRHDLPRRHRRRVPDREPGADEHAAAPAAALLLRPRRRGRDRPARARSRAAWSIRT